MNDWQRSNTDWFCRAGWGGFTHYLEKPHVSADEWNRQVDAFDVHGLARQLHGARLPYYFLTLGQGSGHYCSPNATYDRFVGQSPSKCSRRDLIADLADALGQFGIRLLVYIPADPSCGDPVAYSKLGWQPTDKRTDKRLADFQRRWEDCVREWSSRWGSKVAGWWVDGCYQADEMYRHPDSPNFRSFAAAMKAGNPDALVAFNMGIKTPIISVTEYEDYTAGELAGDLNVSGFGYADKPEWFNFGPIPRFINGAQYHVLNFLGSWWNASPPRFPTDLVVSYTNFIRSRHGVVTWDFPLTREGRVPEEFLEQLAAIGTSRAT